MTEIKLSIFCVEDVEWKYLLLLGGEAIWGRGVIYKAYAYDS